MGGRFRDSQDHFALEALEPRQMLSVQLVDTLSDLPSNLTRIGTAFYYTTRSGGTIHPYQRESGGTSKEILAAEGHTWLRNNISGGDVVKFIGMGDKLLIMADGYLSRRLWAVDPRTLRAAPLTAESLNVGKFGGHAVIGNVLFFVAEEPGGRFELWRSDGTNTGTFRLTGASGGTVPLSEPLQVVGRSLYYRARSTSETLQIFTSDGTVPGTRQLSDFGASIGHFGPTSDGRFYFSEYVPNSRNARIWFGDGTRSGSRLMGEVGDDVNNFHTLGTRLFFTASMPDTGREIWTSDGASAHRLTDLEPGPKDGVAFHDDRKFALSNNALYFSTQSEFTLDEDAPTPRLVKIDAQDLQPIVL